MIDTIDPRDAGRMLFRSAENLRRSSADLNALLASLGEMLEDRQVDLGKIEEAKDEHNGGKHEWITTAYAYNLVILEDLPTKSNKKKKTAPELKCLGTVTFLVRLCGIEEVTRPIPAWPWLDQACLIVGWHWGEGMDDEFWRIEHFEPSSSNLHNTGGRVWCWREDDEDYEARFFVVPIFALCSENDLKRHVLKPLKVLFEGGDAETAFPEDSPALGA